MSHWSSGLICFTMSHWSSGLICFTMSHWSSGLICYTMSHWSSGLICLLLATKVAGSNPLEGYLCETGILLSRYSVDFYLKLFTMYNVQCASVVLYNVTIIKQSFECRYEFSKITALGALYIYFWKPCFRLKEVARGNL
jgi:hypothetical protein